MEYARTVERPDIAWCKEKGKEYMR